MARQEGLSRSHAKRRRTDYHEQIIESLSSGVIALDKHGMIVAANRAACEHLGVPEGCLRRGLRLEELALPEPFVDVMREVITGRQPVHRRDVVVRQPDGTTKEIGLSGSLMHGPDEFNGAIFLFVDMTERRILERAAEINRQLAQVGELTAKVVHELRNPLTVIIGRAELLQRKFDSEDPRLPATQAILEEAKHLERSIAQFLGFARPFEIHPKLEPPAAILDRAVALCRPAAERKGVALDLECPPGLPEMEADAGRLAQAVSNIIGNAIDAVPKEGGRVRCSVRQEGRDILFEITDNGPGLHVEPGEDIFAPFVSKKEGGTGLGLAIVHRIVAAHHGAVSYRNVEQGGCCFVIRAPIRKGALG